MSCEDIVKNNNFRKYQNDFVQKILPFFYLFIIICCIGLYYFYNNNLQKEKYIFIKNIRIEDSVINLKYGETYKVNVQIVPNNATFKGLIWISDNKDLVSVDEFGLIKIEKNDSGFANITAKSNEGGHIASLRVNVEKQSSIIGVTGFKLSINNLELKYGETYKIESNVIPSNATNKNVTFVSSNPSIVSVNNNGFIKVVSNVDEKVLITATTNEGNFSDSVEINVKRNKEVKNVKVKDVKIKNSDLSLKYGETIKLEYNIFPENATDKSVEWISSDDELVSVDNSGKITVLKNQDGSSVITILSNDGNYKDTIKIKVNKIYSDNNLNSNEDIIKVKGISIDKKEIDINYGKSIRLIANIVPLNASNKRIKWQSSDISIVSVDQNGNIKAIKNVNKSVNVVASTEDGNYSASVLVNVKAVDEVIKVKSVEIKSKDISLKYKQSITLVSNVSPSNATNKALIWSSSNSKLVSVDNSGNIKAIKNEDGTSVITVKTVDGSYSDSIKVNVKKETVIEASGVELNQNKLYLKSGESYNLSAKIIPNNTNNKALTWSSSNSDIVSVDSNGKIIAKKSGFATITVKTSNGKKASCKVNIISLSITKGSATIMDEETYKLSIYINGQDGSEKIVWKSSNNSIATVDSGGKIIGKNVGSATITASIITPNKTYTSNEFKINIRNRKILMVGNSKTYQSSLARYVSSMVQEAGYSLEGIVYNNYSSNALSNYPEQDSSHKITYFRDTGGKQLKEIASIHKNELNKYYDYIILQEQTNNYFSKDYNNYYNGVLNILDMVYKKNPNIKMYIRKTWVLSDSDINTINQGYNNTINIVNKIKQTKGYNIQIINDGSCIYDAISKKYNVIKTDKRHQTFLGAYLAASCIYSTVFDKDPTTINYLPNNLNLNDVKVIKNIAKNYC